MRARSTAGNPTSGTVVLMSATVDHESPTFGASAISSIFVGWTRGFEELGHNCWA